MRNITFDHPYHGAISEQFATKRGALEWALKEEHGQCDDSRCDITNMMGENYFSAAASLLMSATDELHFLYAVTEKFGPISRRIADKEQSEWYDYVKPFSRRCNDCNARVWGTDGTAPESCHSCLSEDLSELA